MTIRLSIDRLVIEDSGLVSGDQPTLEAALVEALQAGLASRATGTQPAPLRLRRLVGSPPVLPQKSSATEAGTAIAASLIASLDSAGTLPQPAVSGRPAVPQPAIATSSARTHP